MKVKGNKNILVTGGAGYIGSACTKRLLDLGYQVTVVDNLCHGDKKYVDARAKFVETDLRDEAALATLFTSSNFDAVMHFAALKSVGQSEERPAEYFKNNVGGTMSLLSAMAEHGVGEIIFSSSAAVYAPNDGTPFTERDQLKAINVYGNCKIIEEMLIQELARTGKLKKFAILRYFNVAGDAGLRYIDKAPENIFPILANALSLGERPASPAGRFSIFGTNYDTRDGTCIRDYIHLSDLVDAHIRALEYDSSGIWNLGTSDGTSVKELISKFEKASAKSLSTEASPRRAGDPAVVLADASSAADTLHWQPKHTLTEMVKSTLDTYKI